MQNGATFPLKPMRPEDRVIDRAFMLERGNHKGVDIHKQVVQELIHEDVTHGHSLPLTLECSERIPLSSIAPIRFVEQDTINENGERIPKFQMTHDQSFPGPSGLSVNNRVEEDELPPCMFGFCLLRIIHYIVHTRFRHPTTRILIGKYDIKSAYRRAHLSAKTAAESLMIFEGILYLALRMTFGGAPCPALWSCLSEPICDVANDLIQCELWDHKILHSSNQYLITSPERLSDQIPFKAAQNWMLTYLSMTKV